MFRKAYKAANENINGDPELLKELLAKAEVSNIRAFSPRKQHYIATTVAAVFILCLSLFIFPQYKKEIISENITPSVVLRDDEIKNKKAEYHPAADENTSETEASAKASEKTKSIQPAVNNEQKMEQSTITQDAEQNIAPASEEVTTEAHEPTPAYNPDIEFPVNEAEALTDEPVNESPMVYMRASGGGGGGKSSPTAYSLPLLPEGFEIISDTGVEKIYENGTKRIISTVYENPEITGESLAINGIQLTRCGNTFYFEKNDSFCSLSFENMTEEEINNILTENV